MKVKIFKRGTKKTLEKEINEWLAKELVGEVVFIKQSATMGDTIISIWYK